MNKLNIWIMAAIFAVSALAVEEPKNTYSVFVESCGEDHPDPIRLGALDPDAKKVADIFEAKCQSCHNPAKASGPFVDILDVQELMDKGIIDPSNPSESRIYKSLNRPAAWMPLGGQPLSIDDKNSILFWMAKSAPGAPPSLKESQQPAGELPVISYEDEIACIFRDLIKAVEPNDREYIRYLTLSNISNLGKKKEFEQLTEAVQKLLNSVSYAARLTKAGKVDKYGVIYRIDLREFNLSPDDFDNVVKVGQYPYALKRFDQDEVGFYETAIADLTENQKTISFIRADWFVFTASQPPVYYNLLRIPNTKVQLLKQLGVDQTRQFEDEDAKRVGVRQSGVANFPRVIDRYDLEIGIGPFQYDGSLWTTYDFDNDKDKSNILAFPFGPVGLFDRVLKTDKEFVHQAEEWIYSLPNGLSAYAVFDGKGKLLDAADTKVAIDPDNVGPSFLGKTPTEIVSGVSCMGCHASGMNLFEDVLRDHVMNTVGFNSEEADFAEENFYPNPDLRTSLAAYVSDFTGAQKTIGLPQKVTAKGAEPVYNQARYYNDLVDICELGAEFYIDCADAKRRLARDPALAIQLGYGESITGTASRKNIEDRFDDLSKSFNIGKQIVFGGGGATGYDPSCEISVEKGSYYVGDDILVRIVAKNAKVVKVDGKIVTGSQLVRVRAVKAGFQRILGEVFNDYGSGRCEVDANVEHKVVENCHFKITNRSQWYTLFNLRDRKTSEFVFTANKKLNQNLYWETKSCASYDYLGQFWNSYNGAWISETYALQVDGRYEIITSNGRQVLRPE
jgi:hypothetical protein